MPIGGANSGRFFLVVELLPIGYDNAMERPQIFYELKEFFGSHQVSAKRLAQESGVGAINISRVLSGARKDMSSAKADALRAAMQRLDANETPGSVCHEN